jgi:hypothetical protein
VCVCVGAGAGGKGRGLVFVGGYNISDSVFMRQCIFSFFILFFILFILRKLFIDLHECTSLEECSLLAFMKTELEKQTIHFLQFSYEVTTLSSPWIISA